MEREELLELVQKELGDTQLTLSERTINGELDDSLSDFGDDADANAKAVTRIANRLKRLDGQLHADVAEQVSVYKKSIKGSVEKPKVDKKVKEKESPDPTISDLMKRIEAMEAVAIASWALTWALPTSRWPYWMILAKLPYCDPRA